MYTLYTGCTHQESFDNIKIILQTGEKLDTTKRKVADFISRGLIVGADKIKLTEENITKIVAFVHASITQTAPNYIKESYEALLKRKRGEIKQFEKKKSCIQIEKKRKNFNGRRLF